MIQDPVHTCCTQLPTGVEVMKTAKCKNFTGAGGDGIKCHGKAEVTLVQENGKTISNDVQVAEVTRALHSTGLICDERKEVLFTRGESVVVPEGALSKFLGSVRKIAEYKRKGNLHVAKMNVKRMVQMQKKEHENDSKPMPFGRQGIGR